MIEQVQINGRTALVAYMTADFDLTDKDAASLIKVSFLDKEGGVVFLVPDSSIDEEAMRPIREKYLADARAKEDRKTSTLHFIERLRSSVDDDEEVFMQECVSALEDEGYDDPEYACQIMWENGDDISDVLDRSFDEGQHPRDENGRWTDGSGGSDSSDADIANSKTPAADLLARNHKSELSLEEVKAELPPEFKAEEQKAQAEMKGRMITQKEFMGENGKYTPERAEMHRKIIRELFTDTRIKHATPPLGTKPVLTLSGGRPAAGKTTSLKKELTEKIKTSFYINADEIQEKLPGYKGKLAGLYNAEAQDVALQAEKVARHMGLNIIYDATLKSKQPAMERVENYIDAGYDVDGYFVHTTPATSVARSAARFLGDPDGVGRYLPPEISFNSRTNESTFDALIPKLRKWALYDNNGDKPKRIAGSL
jgi:predicted ABC-type ATPase